jgi:AcrR family transcriptional regulator
MSEADVRSRPATMRRRNQILDETLRIVGQRGYHGFGISELAARCGLSKPGVLHHFGTKEQLLIALLEDCETKEKAELAEAFLPAYATADSQSRRKMFRLTMRAVMARAIARRASKSYCARKLSTATIQLTNSFLSGSGPIWRASPSAWRRSIRGRTRLRDVCWPR